MIARNLIVPFVPSPDIVVQRMLSLANLKPGELVYDLGAGDGRILSTAVQRFGAKAFGVELHATRYAEILNRLSKERIGDSVRVVRGDFSDVSLEDADVVTLYLLTSVNSSIRPKLERELRPGSRVISHDFPIRGWTPTHVETVKDKYNTHEIFVYRIPDSLQPSVEPDAK
jgi:tRNA A58 N-methylase Trm61